MIYDSLLFGVTESNLTKGRAAILWVLLPSATGWLVFLLFCVKSMKRRIKLLFGPLSLALILVAIVYGRDGHGCSPISSCRAGLTT